MPTRKSHGAAARARNTSCSLDLACISRAGGAFTVLLQETPNRGWRLPSAAVRGGESLDDVASRLTRAFLGRDAAWREQSGASSSGADPDGAALSVGFAACVASGTPAPAGTAWHIASHLPRGTAGRHAAIVGDAIARIRSLADQQPIAFRLLPPAFTLGELQETYELLLERPLHKASFRRALTAARLVEPTDKWQGDGRGRPAQYFRYAPRRRSRAARTVRFELLGA